MKGRGPVSAPPRARRVFLVDDHSIVREGLKQLLEAKGDLAVCGEAESGIQALERIPSARPDLVLVDLGLRGMNGLELLKILKQRFPLLPTLVMSMYEESVYAERALKAGARGYIMKKGRYDELLSAIRRVLSDKIYLSSEMAERMVERAAVSVQRVSIDSLTEREFETFDLIGRGFKTGRIADELKVSVKTVEFYREMIKQKLELPDAAELTQFAVDWMHRHRLSS